MIYRTFLLIITNEFLKFKSQHQKSTSKVNFKSQHQISTSKINFKIQTLNPKPQTQTIWQNGQKERHFYSKPKD